MLGLPRCPHHGHLSSAVARTVQTAEDCASRSTSVLGTCSHSSSLCRIRKEWKGTAAVSQETKSTKKAPSSCRPHLTGQHHHIQESPAPWLTQYTLHLNLAPWEFGMLQPSAERESPHHWELILKINLTWPMLQK